MRGDEKTLRPKTTTTIRRGLDAPGSLPLELLPSEGWKHPHAPIKRAFRRRDGHEAASYPWTVPNRRRFGLLASHIWRHVRANCMSNAARQNGSMKQRASPFYWIRGRSLVPAFAIVVIQRCRNASCRWLLRPIVGRLELFLISPSIHCHRPRDFYDVPWRKRYDFLSFCVFGSRHCMRLSSRVRISF